MFGYSLLYLSLAAIAGLTMALQGAINSVLGKKLGIIKASFIVHVVATIILIVWLLTKNDRLNFSISVFKDIPWYLYLGGLFGVIITFTVIISMPRLGVAIATTAIITAQVLTAAVIDHFGIFGLDKVPFTWLKLTGILFMALGVRLLFYK